MSLGCEKKNPCIYLQLHPHTWVLLHLSFLVWYEVHWWGRCSYVCVCYSHILKIFGRRPSAALSSQCCLAEALLIEHQEAAASYRPEPTGVLVRRICDVNAELHLLTRPANLKLRSRHKGRGLARTCFFVFFYEQHRGEANELSHVNCNYVTICVMKCILSAKFWLYVRTSSGTKVFLIRKMRVIKKLKCIFVHEVLFKCWMTSNIRNCHNSGNVVLFVV